VLRHGEAFPIAEKAFPVRENTFRVSWNPLPVTRNATWVVGDGFWVSGNPCGAVQEASETAEEAFPIVQQPWLAARNKL